MLAVLLFIYYFFFFFFFLALFTKIGMNLSCESSNSHEMPSLIFSSNNNRK